jgi:imidazolonepropionase-like amidohydrolase
MSPLQAIQASTINTAKLFGLNKVGQIKEGYNADIVGVYSNPLKDITALEDISFVMKEGKVYKDINK